MSVVDVSHTGVLVEGHVRLLPGTHVDAHVMTRGGRLLIRSRVVRCWVAALQPEAVWYRGALAFDRPVDTASGLPGSTDAPAHDPATPPGGGTEPWPHAASNDAGDVAVGTD